MPPSQVWQYFKKVKSGKGAECSICKKILVLVYCGSTSSLAGHLAKFHKIGPLKQCLPAAMEITDDERAEVQPSASQPNDSVCQSPIVKAFQNAVGFSNDGQKTRRINEGLLYMIAVDNMPFCTPEKRGFQKFIKTIQPLYKAPSIRTRQKHFEEKYTQLRTKMHQRLQNAEHITITTDLWTEAMNVKCFLGLTAHYVNGSEIKSVDIGANQITQRKTIANLKDALKEICTSWHITEDKIIAVVTDNGPNIVGACKEAFGGTKHLPCFAHTLNLVVTKSIDFYEILPGAELPADTNSDQENIEDETAYSELKEIIKKLKKIVGFFKRSESASTALSEMQKEEGFVQSKKLIQEVRTRWNSLYEMINRYLEIHEPVSRALRKIITDKSSKAKPPQDLTGDEVNSLIESIENNLPIDAAAFELRRKLIYFLNEKFKNIEKTSLLITATLLDPRFKRLHFSSDSTVSHLVSKLAARIRDKLATQMQNGPQRPTRANINASSTDGLWDIHDNIVDTQRLSANQDFDNGIPIELRQYLNSSVCERNVNPLEEWEKLKAIYPNLFDIAKEHLGILATSVPCERLFSKAGLIITQQRNRLSSEHINQQLFFQNISESDWFDN